METVETIKEPIEIVFDDIKELIQEKANADNGWLQYKKTSSSSTKLLPDQDYDKLCKIDCDLDELIQKLERELHGYFTKYPQEASEKLEARLTGSLKSMVSELFSDIIIPSPYWLNNPKEHAGNYYWSNPNSKILLGNKGEGAMAQDKELKNLLNKVQRRIDNLLKGNFPKRLESSRVITKRKTKVINLEEIIFPSKWDSFIELCEYYSNEHTFLKQHDFRFISKREGKYYWIGTGRGAGIPALGAFIHCLNVAEYLLPNTKKMRLCCSFLSYFQLREEDEKFLCNQYKAQNGFYTQIFSEKIKKAVLMES